MPAFANDNDDIDAQRHRTGESTQAGGSGIHLAGAFR
jgi:hypothetical protein